MLIVRVWDRERAAWPGEFMESFPKEKGLIWPFQTLLK